MHQMRFYVGDMYMHNVLLHMLMSHQMNTAVHYSMDIFEKRGREGSKYLCLYRYIYRGSWGKAEQQGKAEQLSHTF